jgi:acyl dehydratase
MNEYTYDQITVGQEEWFTVLLSREHMTMFAEISGDINPLHTDAEYAKSKGFSDKVAYGMLTASFLSTLAGVYLPGKYCLIQEVSVSFTNPIIPTPNHPAELTVKGKVTAKQDIYRRVTLSVRILNGDETILRGKMVVGLMDNKNWQIDSKGDDAK